MIFKNFYLAFSIKNQAWEVTRKQWWSLLNVYVYILYNISFKKKPLNYFLGGRIYFFYHFYTDFSTISVSHSKAAYVRVTLSYTCFSFWITPLIWLFLIRLNWIDVIKTYFLLEIFIIHKQCSSAMDQRKMWKQTLNSRQGHLGQNKSQYQYCWQSEI